MNNADEERSAARNPLKANRAASSSQLYSDSNKLKLNL